MTFEARETSRDQGQPFQLMTFNSGIETFRYTTADHIIIDGSGNQFHPDHPMESAEIKETNTDDKGKLNFKVARSHEVAALFLISNPRTISLTIQAGHEGESEFINIWTGRVVACEWDEDDEATISCESATTVLSRNGLPYKFGGTCQHSLYRGGCRLDINDPTYSMLILVDNVDGYNLTFSELVGAPANDYDGGLVVINDVDYRMITGFDSGTGTVTLIRPFEDVDVGQLVRVARGCNRTSTRCKELNNFERFLGFDTVPTRNPFEGLKQAGISVGSAN